MNHPNHPGNVSELIEGKGKDREKAVCSNGSLHTSHGSHAGFVTGFSHSAGHLLALAQKELGASELRPDHAWPKELLGDQEATRAAHTWRFFPDPDRKRKRSSRARTDFLAAMLPVAATVPDRGSLLLEAVLLESNHHSRRTPRVPVTGATRFISGESGIGVSSSVGAAGPPV